MNRAKRGVFIAIAISLAGAVPPPDKTARMEEVIQTYVDKNDFMGSVLVARGDDVLLSKGYGFANLEWNVPNAPNTRFRIGSITKQFTAASILLLEERGKLSVDDLVKKHMPDAPAAWDKITIKHLLTHSSGIPSFTGFNDYEKTKAAATFPKELVGRFRDLPLEFEPGSKMSYNNSGYILLGYLVDKVSGENYPAFVQKNIFDPLGMKDSGYDSPSTIIANRATGYTRSRSGKGGFAHASFVHMSIPYSAGGLYSTTEDLARWQRGLFGGKILSAASLAKFLTPVHNDYAFGVAVTTNNGRKMVAHGGGIEGFNTQLTYYPDEKVVVAVLGNLNGGAPYEIAGKLSAAALGEKVVLRSERKDIQVSPKILAEYAGVYELVPGFSITMTVEDGKLMSQASAQPKFPMFAESETVFFLKVAEVEVEFVREKGKVTHLILHQDGRDVKGIKK